MSNPFIELIKKARDLKWCTQPWCTTCGNSEYRTELLKLRRHLGNKYINALIDLDPNEIVELEDWQGALVIIFIDMPMFPEMELVLETWLPKVRINILFTDLVLYKIAKYLPKEKEVRKNWISECMDIAIKSRHFSLTESLILVLRKEALKYPQLIQLGKEIAASSIQMKRVLLNACEIKIDLPNTTYENKRSRK